MAADPSDIRRLERRAKSMLMDKEIPQPKMELVRSLLTNQDLLPGERYSAIISLIQSCPNKKAPRPQNARIEVPGRKSQRAQDVEIPAEPKHPGPEMSSAFIGHLQWKYRDLKLFKKRYLIHANNRLGIGFKKRLIPTKRCMKVFREMVAFQEEVLSSLSAVMLAILKDETIQDPVDFNYLRLIRRWMLETPLVEYQYDTIKWLDRNAFESELKNFVLPFFAFQKVSIERREHILQTIETMLRTLPDYKKEEINEKDPEQVRREKEKLNLAREKRVYDYMVLMRSFLPSKVDEDNKINVLLRNRYDIPTYAEFLRMVMEVLVFWCDMDYRDLERYYEIETPVVRTGDWDYSLSELKKYGKDPESRKRRKVDLLKERLNGYDALLEYLKLKQQGHDLLVRAYEEQWKTGSRRLIDIEEIKDNDFIKFLDGCLNFYNNSYLRLLDGSLIYLDDPVRNPIDGSFFSPEYFSSDTAKLKEILTDFYRFRSDNPITVLSREEVKRICRGQIKSMGHVETLLRSIGAYFYTIAKEVHWLLDLHTTWCGLGAAARDPELLRIPLSERPSFETEAIGRPFPFFDCKINGFQRPSPLDKGLVGRALVDNMENGVFPFLVGFCYQLAWECMHFELLEDLEERKKIIRELRELAGKAL